MSVFARALPVCVDAVACVCGHTIAEIVLRSPNACHATGRVRGVDRAFACGVIVRSCIARSQRCGCVCLWSCHCRVLLTVAKCVPCYRASTRRGSSISSPVSPAHRERTLPRKSSICKPWPLRPAVCLCSPDSFFVLQALLRASRGRGTALGSSTGAIISWRTWYLSCWSLPGTSGPTTRQPMARSCGASSLASTPSTMVGTDMQALGQAASMHRFAFISRY